MFAFDEKEERAKSRTISRKCRTLPSKELSLIKCRLTPQNAVTIIKSLPDEIESLNLDDNYFSGNTQVLANALCGKKIKELHLENFGVPFSRTKDGKIYQRPFGGMTTH